MQMTTGLLGKHLEDTLPVQAFGTLTTPSRRSRDSLLHALHHWLGQVEALLNSPLGAIWSVERVPGLHIHVALVCAWPISVRDCALAEELWRTLVHARNQDAAQIRVYQNGICGMTYILKALGSATEEVEMSSYIAGFYLHSPLQHFGKNSREKRKIRRIHQHMAQAAAYRSR